MEVRKVVDLRQDDAGAPRVFGEPFETTDGSTIISVARVHRGLRLGRLSGGGAGRRGGDLAVSPVGVFVIHGGRVRWQPTVDSTRLALLGELIGLASAVIATLAVLRRPPWPDLRRR
ncbi:spore germination protein GerW family protein [Rhodococcus tibetensis]|uniref:Spore germination protein GerW family protein n=1 Tax=Rhodococcus tibetensis TaxID=2965064 RepID=A0ABT1QE92_9NOCA|nr:spore germination protein GerW family protein [Rhodococcus sp. FXJ9.536]MCQ4120609.1 spore germination protein GerW family protein [Rhodococcus sp. FXJ9.536]